MRFYKYIKARSCLASLAELEITALPREMGRLVDAEGVDSPASTL